MEAYGEHVIRVGSRKSELALIQTNYVIDCLKKVYPELKFDIVTMTTLGDRILNISLPKIGEKSLFTKDLEDALHCGTVDFVVHSLKDLPTTLPDGLAIGAVFEREDPRDALVLRSDLKDKTLASLPPESCIGTSSLRRTAQLRALHPHLRVVDVRGNLNTRLRKLQQHSGDTGDAGECGREGQEYAALILAQSGMVRMGWQEKISQVLPCSQMMYAVGQGALAVECRADNARVLSMLAPFNHAESYCRTLAERSFLKTLGGGCSAPVGVSTSLKPLDNQHRLTISGAVWSLDGTIKVHDKVELLFPQIRRTEASKHKLSPTADSEQKKVKIDGENSPERDLNPIEEYNRRISDIHNKNCEDSRSAEEIRGLISSQSNIESLARNVSLNSECVAANPIEEYNRRISGLQKNEDLNCEDTRSKEEIEALVKNQAQASDGDLRKSDLMKDGNGTKVEEVKLHCGFSENTNVLADVIEKCEGLGKELANNLISKGALDVMKISQDYIRSSVKKT